GVVGWTGVAGARAGRSGSGANGASPNERVSVGVIGIRSQGKTLASTLTGLPNVDVAALCDVDESLLPQAARDIEARQGQSPRMATEFSRPLADVALDGADRER